MNAVWLKLCRNPLWFVCFLLLFHAAVGQNTYPVNGVHDERPEVYALTHATLYVDYKTVIEDGAILMRKGRVEQVGKTGSFKIPPEAVVYDLTGQYIHPGFIELYSNYGMPALKERERQRGQALQFVSKKRGPFSWNEAIRPEYNAAEHFEPDEKKAQQLREQGFTTVLSHQPDGIVRGSGVLVNLGDDLANKEVIRSQAAAMFSFMKGSTSQNYPTSLMGAIALIRQAYYDAQWYKMAKVLPETETNLSMEAMLSLTKLPVVFSVDDALSVLRAAQVGREFGYRYIIKGAGDAYQQLDEIMAMEVPLVVPLNFPEPYDVEDPWDALNVSLSQMMHWALAPANATLLEEKGIEFAFTASGLKKPGDWLKNWRKALQYGLSDSTALKALTRMPAELLNVTQDLGSLEPGKYANLVVASGPLKLSSTELLQTWVDGQPYLLEAGRSVDIRGTYKVYLEDKDTLEWEIKGKRTKPILQVLFPDSSKVKGQLALAKNQLTISFHGRKADSASYIRLSGLVSGDVLSGTGMSPTGSFSWRAIRESPSRPTDTLKLLPIPRHLLKQPFSAYGWDSLPAQKDCLIRNATVWTNESQGVVKGMDVLISNGIIQAIADSLDASGAEVIDGRGMHLTPGIIDEHSHIAISHGVNEASEAVTAEVRIGDVVNSEDINIYRQLAGGVTTSQLLHGSANPIGGQSALIKHRWGLSPEKLKFKNAAPFIKFALGENVKQSNWGDHQTTRYPQTRMGVEQIYYDAFFRASDHLDKWEAYKKLPRKQREGTIPPRVDLELQALAEILQQERFITCHSYVQSEINMLMHVADSFHFRVNTFTHILEGYKVADKMKIHGAGASTFSDWWAYKYEVVDAIPYNAAILNKMGIVTAINSDDAEMGRRLNQEAAKAIRYGGVSEEDALKMITLNPAKLLQIDHRVGTIKIGKDADLVLWDQHPLSVYAKPVYAFVDGIPYFSLARDRMMRARIAEERERLIQEMLKAKAKGASTQKAKEKPEDGYHCEDLEDEWTIEQF